MELQTPLRSLHVEGVVSFYLLANGLRGRETRFPTDWIMPPAVASGSSSNWATGEASLDPRLGLILGIIDIVLPTPKFG